MLNKGLYLKLFCWESQADDESPLLQEICGEETALSDILKLLGGLKYFILSQTWRVRDYCFFLHFYRARCLTMYGLRLSVWLFTVSTETRKWQKQHSQKCNLISLLKWSVLCRNCNVCTYWYYGNTLETDNKRVFASKSVSLQRLPILSSVSETILMHHRAFLVLLHHSQCYIANHAVTLRSE
jgi:hypothetical protein